MATVQAKSKPSARRNGAPVHSPDRASGQAEDTARLRCRRRRSRPRRWARSTRRAGAEPGCERQRRERQRRPRRGGDGRSGGKWLRGAARRRHRAQLAVQSRDRAAGGCLRAGGRRRGQPGDQRRQGSSNHPSGPRCTQPHGRGAAPVEEREKEEEEQLTGQEEALQKACASCEERNTVAKPSAKQKRKSSRTLRPRYNPIPYLARWPRSVRRKRNPRQTKHYSRLPSNARPMKSPSPLNLVPKKIAANPATAPKRQNPPSRYRGRTKKEEEEEAPAGVQAAAEADAASGSAPASAVVTSAPQSITPGPVYR